MRRNEEKKKEHLKAIVSQLICQNQLIVDVVKETKSRRSGKFLVQITEDSNSHGSKENCHIFLGVGNFEKLYEICNSFSRANSFLFNTSIIMLTDGDLNIENYDVKESFLDKIDFLNEDTFDAAGTLAINGLAFALYHEFGHVKYDDGYELQIEKERKADLFAMDVVKEMCSDCIPLDRNPIFLGAYLENILMLSVCNPNEAEILFSHPHPIERIIILLEYFHIEENSYLWKYAYDEITKWINANNMSMTYERNSSITIKDKLMDAFCRFKK